MKVTLRSDIAGTRDGKDWPSAGSQMDLPDDEALALLRSGDAVAVNDKDGDVEKRVAEVALENQSAAVKRATTTRERQAQSKRAHEPLNLGAADPEQPAEDDNGPRLPEINAEESAKVADPTVPTQSLDGPTGETKPPTEGKGDTLDDLKPDSGSTPAKKTAATKTAPAKQGAGSDK